MCSLLTFPVVLFISSLLAFACLFFLRKLSQETLPLLLMGYPMLMRRDQNEQQLLRTFCRVRNRDRLSCKNPISAIFTLACTRKLWINVTVIGQSNQKQD